MRILLLCALVAAPCAASTWNYDSNDPHGPPYWPDKCVLAESTRQSPIDINTGAAVTQMYDPSFSMSGYSKLDVTITNNGHTAKIELASAASAILEGGGLSGKYKLAQFHLHWGKNSSKGSEHKLDGTQFPMEVHLVHYKESLGNLSYAQDKPEGLAVLAWFFEIGSENGDWQKIFDFFDGSFNEGSTGTLSGLDVTNMIGNVGTFYRYAGSLTTPPCYQSVVWTVFVDKISVSETQMEMVRTLLDANGHEISDNFRPIQDLNGRTVYKKG